MHIDFFLFASVVSVLISESTLAEDISCASTIDPNFPNPNLCAGATSGGGDPLPNCMNVGTETSPTWICAACSHNCDCSTGYYCSKGPGRIAGQCMPLKDDAHIGKPCMIFGVPGTTGAIVPTLGYDDQLVCGVPIFQENGTFLRYDWIGACVDGECRECDGGMISWTLAPSWAAMIPSTTAIPATAGFQGVLARDGGTLLCPERFCREGKLSTGAMWIFDIVPHEIAAATLAFVVLIYLFLLILCIMACCNRSNACSIIGLCRKRTKSTPGSHAFMHFQEKANQ